MQIDMSKNSFHPPGRTKGLLRTHRAQSAALQKAIEPNTKLLPMIDIFNLKGFQCSYSVTDAAASLWQRENTRVRRDDAPSVARLQARLRSGNFRMTPTQKEIKDYLIRLRRDGLDGQIDWPGLIAELRSFQNIPPEELISSLDYVASRYVSVQDKLKRNFTGCEFRELESKLEDIWAAGVTGLVDGYVNFLKSNLGLSDLDANAARISLDVLMEQRICVYRAMVKQINITTASQGGLDGCWLCNHDAYMATRLREAAAPAKASSIPARGIYSAQDLMAAGWVAQIYQFEIESAAAGRQNEAQLALNFAFADMKEETLIQKNLISERMAELLRKSRPQGHAMALDAVARYLDSREASGSPDEPESPYAAVERTVFRDIYEAVLNAYHRNGGDGAEAIRAGVTHGKAATAKAYAKDPDATRWGKSMDQYWETFYTVPRLENQTASEQQIEQMLAMIGRSSRRSNSTYQNYRNDWGKFVSIIQGTGYNLKAQNTIFYANY